MPVDSKKRCELTSDPSHPQHIRIHGGLAWSKGWNAGEEGVQLEIKQSIVNRMEKRGIAVEIIPASLTMIGSQVTGSNEVSIEVAYTPQESDAIAEKISF